MRIASWCSRSFFIFRIKVGGAHWRVARVSSVWRSLAAMQRASSWFRQAIRAESDAALRKYDRTLRTNTLTWALILNNQQSSASWNIPCESAKVTLASATNFDICAGYATILGPPAGSSCAFRMKIFGLKRTSRNVSSGRELFIPTSRSRRLTRASYISIKSPSSVLINNKYRTIWKSNTYDHELCNYVGIYAASASVGDNVKKKSHVGEHEKRPLVIFICCYRNSQNPHIFYR